MKEISIEIEDSKEEKEYGKFDKWEVEDALHTLKRAEKVRADKELMKAVEMCAKKEVKAITSIAGLKAKAKSLAQEESEY